MADQPGFTRMPNEIIEAMPDMSEAELRVVLAIARKTIGWGKDWDRLGLKMLIDLTGLSRQGVLDGLEAARTHGWIERKPVKNSYAYCLKTVWSVDHSDDRSTDQTGLPTRPETVYSVDRNEQKMVYSVDTQKKDLKEKKEKRVRAPKQVSMNNFNEAVQVYKELSGVKNIQPFLIDKIADTITDIPAWKAAIEAWIGAGLKPGNVDGMIDWYADPKRMERKNGTHKPERHPPDRRNGTGSNRAAELDAYLKRLPDD